MAMDGKIISFASGFRMQWEPSQKTHVLLYPEGMIKLSDSASEILSRCAGELDREGVIGALEQAFPGADLRNDVIEFLEVALERGWIVEG
ncbi:MAG: pyrroloquinoline quinone biosynthesis peptide chaperone PqqD [Pseudomonadota bacterium]